MTAGTKPFTYNLAQFISAEVDIDTDRIPVYETETQARGAGHVEGDVFRTPDGRLGVIGILPPDGRE